MRVLSLYCGAGGIDEGLRQAGIKTTLAIDMWDDACKTLKLNHPDTEVLCGKVSDYKDSLSGYDMIVGGPPCPEFSRAKTNRTFDMCEVNNFWEIVYSNRPKYFIMENVQDVKKKLYKTSYLINCADYGVPQTRLRRFFTNLPRPTPTHSEKPVSTLDGNQTKKWVSVKEALGLDGIIEDRKTKYFGETEYRRYSVDKPHHTLITDSRDFFISVEGYSKCNQIEKTRPIDEPSQTVMASRDLQITDHRIYSQKYLEQKNTVMYQKHPPNTLDKPSSTIASKDRGLVGDGMVTDGTYARKLTNEELSILQGFPTDYKWHGNKGSVRRQIGNAVPPPVIRAFASMVN